MIHSDINSKSIYIFQIMKISDLQIYEMKKKAILYMNII